MGRGASRCTWQAWESPDKTISFQVGAEEKSPPTVVQCHCWLLLQRCEVPGEGFWKMDGYGSICYAKHRLTTLPNAEGRKTG